VQEFPANCPAEVATAVNEKLPAAVIRNSAPMSPLPLLAGVPPVPVTVALPTVRVSTRVLLVVSVPKSARAELVVVVLVYVIELAAVLELRNTSVFADVGALPSIDNPLMMLALLMPMYTLLCPVSTIPLQFSVAPPLPGKFGEPGTQVQVPPPGSDVPLPVITNAEALLALSTLSNPKRATCRPQLPVVRGRIFVMTTPPPLAF
jgi:hypothetical protein